jgi:hypothetical protein
VRFTFLEAVYTILVVAGGLTALVANRLGWDVLKNAGLIVVFLGVIVFGLDMVVQRRAEIGTRYSSSVNPSFHVFRGFGAVAWGLVFVLAGSLFAGYAYLGQHTGVLVIMGGNPGHSLGSWKRNRSYLSISWDGEAGPAIRRSRGSHFLNCSIRTRNSRLGTSQNVRAIRGRCVRRGSEERGCSMDRIPLELSFTPQALQRASTQARCFFQPHRDGDGNRKPCGRFLGDPGNENLRHASRGIQRVL